MTAPARACPACRTPLPEEALFCLHCGAATPTEPGVPPRTAATDIGEIVRVRKALAATYAIERVLGEGGMATVYLATDLKHRRQVAVKVTRVIWFAVVWAAQSLVGGGVAAVCPQAGAATATSRAACGAQRLNRPPRRPAR